MVLLNQFRPKLHFSVHKCSQNLYYNVYINYCSAIISQQPMQPISSQKQPPKASVAIDSYVIKATPQISIKKTSSALINTPKWTKKQNLQNSNLLFQIKRVESHSSPYQNSDYLSNSIKYSTQPSESGQRESNKLPKNETRIGKPTVSKIIGQTLWECPNRYKPMHQNCKFCHGTGKTSQQSPLIKFFLYVLNYKLNAQNQAPHEQHFNPEIKSSQQSRKHSNYKFRLSTCSTTSTRPDITHFGYYCNACGLEKPIVGVRYNCPNCPDYDLCSSCFQSKGHQHRMKRVEVPLGYRRAEEVAKNMRSSNMRGSLVEANHRLLRLQEEMLSRSLK